MDFEGAYENDFELFPCSLDGIRSTIETALGTNSSFGIFSSPIYCGDVPLRISLYMRALANQFASHMFLSTDVSLIHTLIQSTQHFSQKLLLSIPIGSPALPTRLLVKVLFPYKAIVPRN